MATEVEIIEAYERLFFNVRERLANRGYLMHCVLGPAVHLGFQSSEYDLIWKLFAFLGGPLAVDLMIDQSVGHARPDRAGDLKYFVADVAQNDLRRVAMLALKTLRINNFNAMEIIDKFLKLVELERTGGSRWRDRHRGSQAERSCHACELAVHGRSAIRPCGRSAAGPLR